MSQAKSFKQQQKSLLAILEMVAIDESSINSKEISPDEIYELRSDDMPLGKFWSFDLKNMVKTYPDLFSSSIYIKSQNDADWAGIFSHPLFQRRAPELLSEDTENILENYMIRIGGEVFGPLPATEIENKLKDNSLLFTDTISIDSGKNWLPICKRAEFNRRKRSAQQLPPAPENNIFALSQFEVLTDLIDNKEDPDQQCLNVIAGLAYVGQVHNGHILSEEEHQHNEEQKHQTPVSKSIEEHVSTPASSSSFLDIFQRKNMIISIVSFLLITIGFFWSISNNTPTPTPVSTVAKKKNKVYSPKAQKLHKRTIVQNKSKINNRMPARAKPYKRKISKVKSRRAKNQVKAETSFLESDTYNDRNYGEQSENVEQDDLQSSLSKDIIDPERDMEDDYLEDDNRTLSKAVFDEGPDSEIDLFNEEFSE